MTIEERLEKMEMKMRRNNHILLVVVFLAVLAITLGTTGIKDVIEARAFILVDDNGKARAKLLIDKGMPGLALCDENGKSRVVLGVNKDGPGLALCDENEKYRVGLGVNKDGPALLLTDENEKTRIGLVANKDGPELRLCDENGKVTWRAGR
jgi:hypothetical protein